MLQGAFTPPYWPALPAQILGSISLCGGARSNLAQPHSISRGENKRSWEATAFPTPLEDGSLLALKNVAIRTGSTTINTSLFIHPPKFVCTDSFVLRSGKIAPAGALAHPSVAGGSRPSPA